MVIPCNLASTNKLDDHQPVDIQQSFHKAMDSTDFEVAPDRAPVLLVVVYTVQMDLQSNLVDNHKVGCDLWLDILETNKQKRFNGEFGIAITQTLCAIKTDQH